MATSSTQPAAPSTPNYMGPFITVTVLYFILGFITNLNMGLVPYLRNIFEIQKLQVWQAMLANGAFFTAYLVSGPAAKLIGVIGCIDILRIQDRRHSWQSRIGKQKQHQLEEHEGYVQASKLGQPD